MRLGVHRSCWDRHMQSLISLAGSFRERISLEVPAGRMSGLRRACIGYAVDIARAVRLRWVGRALAYRRVSLLALKRTNTGCCVTRTDEARVAPTVIRRRHASVAERSPFLTVAVRTAIGPAGTALTETAIAALGASWVADDPVHPAISANARTAPLLRRRRIGPVACMED